MRLLSCLIPVLLLCGCETCPQGVYAPQAASACAPAAAPCAAAAAPVQYVAPAPAYALAYGPAGVREHLNTALAIPPNMAICLVQGLRCAIDALFPVAPPSVSYVPVTGVGYQFVVPQAPAAPCAPRQVMVAPAYVPAPAAPCR